MRMMECSADRPWGIHPRLLSDAPCPRCGWIAPGPIGDARIEALEALELMKVLQAAEARGEVPPLAA